MGGAACIFNFKEAFFMQKIRFFIYNKDKFSVVIRKGEKVIKEKTFKSRFSNGNRY